MWLERWCGLLPVVSYLWHVIVDLYSLDLLYFCLWLFSVFKWTLDCFILVLVIYFCVVCECDFGVVSSCGLVSGPV